MTLIIAEEQPRQPEVVDLLRQSDAYAQSLYPADSNHLIDLSELEKPSVTFLVARSNGAISGCCALVGAGDGTGEIKRLFVDPKARGLKIGRHLLDAVEQHGLARNISVIRLETGIYQPEAINLYRRAGYVEIGPFGTYQPDPLSLFMQKTIGP